MIYFIGRVQAKSLLDVTLQLDRLPEITRPVAYYCMLCCAAHPGELRSDRTAGAVHRKYSRIPIDFGLRVIDRGVKANLKS